MEERIPEQLELFEKPQNELGEKIAKLQQLHEQRAQVEQQSKALGAEIESLSADIMRMMDDAKLEAAKHGSFVVEPLIRVFPKVVDWDAFYEFISVNKYWHLLERRPTATGYREMLTLGREVPGVVKFDKRILTTRKV